ncbi:hypothetical protein WI39_05830 [Burkholderia ubonensis]|nr:hypothetical protein WI39_05830 [Burkholderia ubonensis]
MKPGAGFGRHTWQGFAVGRCERGPQYLVPSDDSVKRATQCRSIQGAVQMEADLKTECALIPVQLIEKPQPLLRG